MDTGETEKIEQARAAVDLWIGKITNEGIVAPLDSSLAKTVLESYGANFELSEEAKVSLKKKWNRGRRPGMDAVWGHDNVKVYRIWLKNWIEGYEQKTGNRLPIIKNATEDGSESKTSGGLKFFSDLTVFAAGLMSETRFRRLTFVRAEKGRRWQVRDLAKPRKPTAISSFPPEFPLEAWNFIKTLKTE